MTFNDGNINFLANYLQNLKKVFEYKSVKEIQEIKKLVTDDLITKSLSQPLQKKYDIAILSVIDVEFEMLVKVFKVDTVYPLERLKCGSQIYETEVNTIAGDTLKVLVCKIGRAGNINSSIVTNQLINSYEIDLFILVGIAAGVRDKVALGDVVISSKVYYYEIEKLVPMKRLERGEFRHARKEVSDKIIEVKELDDENLTICNDIYSSQEKYKAYSFSYKKTSSGRNQIRNGKPIINKKEKIKSLKPIIHSDKEYIILSGEKLLADGSLNEMKEYHDFIRACEMEGAGFSEACHTYNKDWLVIRGISDFGDIFKNDTFHYAASLNAAIVSKAFIEKYHH